MRIQASCDSCSHEFSVSSASAGKRVRCPECDEPVRVPDDAPPKRRSSSSKGRSRSPKAAKGNQTAVLIGVGGGIGGAILVGLLLVLMRSPAAPPAPPAPPAAPDPAPVAMAQPAANPTAPAATAQAAPASIPMATTTPAPVAPANTATIPMTTTTAATTPGTAPATAAVTPGATDDGKPKTGSDRVKLDMVDLIAKVEPSVVRISTSGPRGGGTGSGFVVDSKGTIVTNVHVIAGARKVEVEFSNGVKAPVIGFHSLDQKKDIAIIKVDLPADKLQPVPLAKGLPPKGTAVVAFGAPHGLSFTTTEGIISALRPADEMKEQFGEDFQGDWIQTSTPISPGNSGGPLVNHFGEVVAMNTMQMTIGQNLNFAMSSVDIAEAVAKAPAEYKPITPEDVKTAPSTRSRSMASDETGTDRGRKLLSEVAEIFVLNATNRKTLALDPTGQIWTRVINKSKAAVEKSKIELSFGEPSDDAAIMFVVLEMKTSQKKGVVAGTQELHIKAELICKDDFAKKGESKVCRIWTGEEVLGTISIASLQNGTYPRTAEEKLSGFFNKFRAACVKARESQKGSDDKSEKPAKSEKSSTRDK